MNKRTVISLLVCVNLILLTAIVLFSYSPPKALAQGVSLSSNYLLETLMLCVPGAFAQDDEPQAPFDVQGRKHHTNWVAWTASFLFAVGVVLIAFKNPHRSHLD